MSLKEINMPNGAKDIDDLVRKGMKVPEPVKLDIGHMEAGYGGESGLNVVSVSRHSPNSENPLVMDFDSFVLSESSVDMEKRMLADKFVLGRLAILGQSTVFYGGPNVGKTLLMLWLLIENIKVGEVDPLSVYYINADDTFKGLVQKKKLAEQYEFNMLVPGREGFKAPMLPVILQKMIADDKARGCVVILDTLKKFADLMSKKVGSEFGEIVREFVANGGTVIGLAHVNKYKNDDGESIHAGTTDMVDDSDCVYILDLIEDNGGLRTVKFRNIKDRGDVAQTAVYGYKAKNDVETLPYMDLFNSVREITAGEARDAEKRAAVADRLSVNHELILAIKASIEAGNTLQGDIMKSVNESTAASRTKIHKVLTLHAGTDTLKGHRWTCAVGERNAHTYAVL